MDCKIDKHTHAQQEARAPPDHLPEQRALLVFHADHHGGDREVLRGDHPARRDRPATPCSAPSSTNRVNSGNAATSADSASDPHRIGNLLEHRHSLVSARWAMGQGYWWAWALGWSLVRGRPEELPQLKGLKTVSVVDALVSSLRTRVLDSEIDAGVGLTETDVATEYEVSRPTAKTAINQLVLEGLLRREAHKSAHVPNLSRDDVDDLFLVRIPLELEVVRRVAGGGVPEAAAQAVRDLAAVGAGAGHDEFARADLRFHRVLVRAVGSPRLTRLYQALSGEIHLSMVQSRYALGRDRMVAEHGGVLTALEQHDVAAAESLMRAHLEGARDALGEQFDQLAARAR